MPYTLNDAGAISNVAGKWRLSSGADPQWITRLLTLPGAQARIRAATTTVPWYYESTGLRHDPMPDESSGAKKKWWEVWKAESFGADPHYTNWFKDSGSRTIITVGAIALIAGMMYSKDE
jgi:hypothetical protein